MESLFDHPPYFIVLWRALFFAILVFVFSFCLVGILATSKEVIDFSKPPTALSLSSIEIKGRPFVASFQLWAWVLEEWSHVPEVCEEGKAVNEFQKNQCSAFRNLLYLRTALSGIPFLMVVLFFLVLVDRVRSFYQRVRKKIQLKQASFTARVTDPPKVPGDFFSYVHGLGALGVQNKEGEQLKVYVPYLMKTPEPGETLALFDLGSKQYVAIPYMPHVMVLQGG